MTQNSYYFRYDEFDHTVGCWLTDYMQAILMITIGIYVYLLQYNQKNSQIYITRHYTFIFQIFSGFYALLSAIVHQFFLSNDYSQVFTIVWNFGVNIGFIGFISYCFATYSSIFRINKYIIWVYIALILIGTIISWATPPLANTILIGFIFACIILYIIIAILQLYTKMTRNKKDITLFAFQMIGIAFVFVGASFQIGHININEEYFNYNTAFHTFNIIGIPFYQITFLFVDHRLYQKKTLVAKKSSESKLLQTGSDSDSS